MHDRQWQAAQTSITSSNLGQFEHRLNISSHQYRFTINMFISKAKQFVSIINSDAILFLSTRLVSIFFCVTSIILLCRAITVQRYFLTDGLGIVYNTIPFGPVSTTNPSQTKLTVKLAYSLTWSVVSVILPGLHRRYYPGLDVALDFLGLAFQLAAGGALLLWSMKDAYEVELCKVAETSICLEAALSLSVTEISTAVLLLLIR